MLEIQHFAFYNKVLCFCGKDSACTAGDAAGAVGSIPGSGKEWKLTPIFLPRKFHGQKSLVGYSPWDHRVGHN